MAYHIMKDDLVIARYPLVKIVEGVLIAQNIGQMRADYYLAPGQWDCIFWEDEE